jgi:hypothetical protein
VVRSAAVGPPGRLKPAGIRQWPLSLLCRMLPTALKRLPRHKVFFFHLSTDLSRPRNSRRQATPIPNIFIAGERPPPLSLSLSLSSLPSLPSAAPRGHDILSPPRLRRNERANARLIDAELRNPEKSRGRVAAISARARGDIKNRLRVKSHDERTCSPRLLSARHVLAVSIRFTAARR